MPQKPGPPKPKITPSGVLNILNNYKDRGLYVQGNIPEKKLINAMRACNVSDAKTVIGVIDCTVLGSCKCCILFTETGISYRNDKLQGGEGFIPYDSFPERVFDKDGFCKIGLGEGHVVNVSGCPISLPKIVKILFEIKRLASSPVEAPTPANHGNYTLDQSNPEVQAGGTVPDASRTTKASENALSLQTKSGKEAKVFKNRTEFIRYLIPRYKDMDLFFVDPNIPEKKLKNARESCMIPDQKTVLGVLDLTAMGSAKNCVVFMEGGIYIHTPKIFKEYIAYSEFRNLGFSPQDLNQLNIGQGCDITFPRDFRPKLLRLLNAIKLYEHETQDGFKSEGKRLQLSCHICGSLHCQSNAINRNPHMTKSVIAGTILGGPVVGTLMAMQKANDDKMEHTCQKCGNIWKSDYKTDDPSQDLTGSSLS